MSIEYRRTFLKTFTLGVSSIVASPLFSFISKAAKNNMQTIKSIKPLGFQWETSDPFLFCVHHEDDFPEGNEKILKPFGKEFHEFDMVAFAKFCAEEIVDKKDQTTPGIFAPWLISKEDFLAVGGHDAKSFAPYPHEDQDIFMRWKLAGYKLIQSRDSLNYHFISKGHRSWAKNGVGKDDNMFQFYNNRASRNYLRKWRKWMSQDEFRMPITHKVFDIAFVIRDVTDVNFLHFVEPWANVVYVDNIGVAGMYIKTEQLTTKLDLSQRVKAHPAEASLETPKNDIVLEFSQKDFLANANENAGIISRLTDILSDGVEDNSEFEYGIFKLKTKVIKDLAPTLIKV